MATFSSRMTATSGRSNPYAGLRGMIEGAYGNLRSRGRENQAFGLQEAERRFKAAGTKSGISAFGRARNLANLTNQMNAARGAEEARLTAEQVRALAGITGQESSYLENQRQFDEGLKDRAQARAQQQGQFEASLAEQKRQAGIANMNTTRDRLLRQNQLRLAQRDKLLSRQGARQRARFLGGKSKPAFDFNKMMKARAKIADVNAYNRRRTAGGYTASHIGKMEIPGWAKAWAYPGGMSAQQIQAIGNREALASQSALNKQKFASQLRTSRAKAKA